MNSYQLETYLAIVEARKAALGIADTREAVEALRNKGVGRTPTKRAALARMDERAREIGETPIDSRY